MIWLWIGLGVVVLIALGAVVAYNRFVSQKQLIKDSWANIDTELRRRYDLIPNLVETVKGYAAHERGVFDEVTRARAAAVSATGTPAEQAAAEGPFVAALRQLFAVAENYPDLKANQNFLALQQELSNTEDRLQTARRFYNANVRDYNRRVQSFPSNTIAGMFRFEVAEFFEIPDVMREAGPPQVNFTQPGPSVSFGAPGTPAAERSAGPEAASVTSAPPPPPPPPPPPGSEPPGPPQGS
jgi:LemA protein